MHSQGQQSGAYALLFNATYVCTLQFTIGFNFLTSLQLGQWSATEFALPDCAFTNVSGNMDVVPVLGSSFFVFFPVVTGLMVVIFAFNLHMRFLKACKLVTAPQPGEKGETNGLLSEGISLIRERKAALADSGS